MAIAASKEGSWTQEGDSDEASRSIALTLLGKSKALAAMAIALSLQPATLDPLG
jgi:hypothetical protein